MDVVAHHVDFSFPSRDGYVEHFLTFASIPTPTMQSTVHSNQATSNATSDTDRRAVSPMFTPRLCHPTSPQ